MDDEIVEEAVAAYSAGNLRDDCPYPVNDRRREVWLQAWDDPHTIFSEDETWDGS